MQMNGIDAQLLTRRQVAERAPLLEMSPQARFAVLGGFMQRRAGTARHDAVAWGYARAADACGVDILQSASPPPATARYSRSWQALRSR